MVDSWGSGAIMGTTIFEIGHAVPQTVAVLTSDAGQSVSKDIIFSNRKPGLLGHFGHFGQNSHFGYFGQPFPSQGGHADESPNWGLA